MRRGNPIVSGLAMSLAAGAIVPALGLAEINVVASIKPVHSLVAGPQGIGEPACWSRLAAWLRLRPSDAGHSDQAHVVFWVGESLETYLAKRCRRCPRRRSSCR